MNRFLLLACLLVFLALPALAGDIVALCIGNNEYVRPEDVLDTPVNDARLMHETLCEVPGVVEGDIILLENAQRSEITLALRQFRARSVGARLALVFYSGHGVEDTPTGYDRAETFLLPVEAAIQNVDDLPDKAVPLKMVLEALDGTRGAARAVILDCCRDGAPGATKSLARAGKSLGGLDDSVKKALGGAVLSDGTLIAFAASPGRKAAAFLTESDMNSPFTRFISEQISTQGGDLFSIVNSASRITKERTEMRQVPHVELRGDASLITDFSIPAARPVRLTTGQMTPSMAEEEIERRARELAMKMAAEAAAGGTAGSAASGNRGESFLDQGDVGKRVEANLGEGVKMTFCYCPSGGFFMGSPPGDDEGLDDERQVPVVISKDFWMGQTEVTQRQWVEKMGSNPSHFKGDDLPVEMVSWRDAQAFIKRMNESVRLPTGWRFALPTEAQWEYACRAWTITRFHYGDELDGSQANFDGNYPVGTEKLGPYLEKTTKVGSYAANEWGLHDMHGNVLEWCADKYQDRLSGGADPVGTSAEEFYVTRGGSWNSMAHYCRAAYRDFDEPGARSKYLGFRLVLVRSN